MLTLSEDRATRLVRIYTPPGGEVEVRKGQTFRQAAALEVWQEVGIGLDQTKLMLIGDPQLILPTKEYDPYKGVGLIILSYFYRGEWQPENILPNKVPEQGSMIVDHRLVPLPNSIEEINDWARQSIGIFPNYKTILLEISKMVKEGDL